MSIYYAEPPDPPDGLAWCGYCLMLAKMQLYKEHEAKIKAAADDGRDLWVPWDNSVKIFPARHMTYSELGLQLGLLSLCFTHVGGLDLKPVSQLAPGPGAIPPSLIRGSG